MCKSIRRSCFFLSSLYKLLVFTFAFVFYFPIIASAAQVTLEWDENSEEDLAGYRVFCRQEGHNYDYYNLAWEGSETTCTIFDLDDNTTYYFVARAYNTSGDESGNSNQVCHRSEDGEVITMEVRVGAGSDDAEEQASGSMYLTSTDLELFYDAYRNTGDQTVGIRFNWVDIPQGNYRQCLCSV